MMLALPGNRQGHMPARMVGSHLCTEKMRLCGRDAASVEVNGGRVHGGTLPLLIFLLLSNSSFAGIVLNQKAPPPLKTVQQLRAEATPEEWEAAKGIEALLVDQMVQEMRKTVPENDIIPVSNGEKIFRTMLDSEYSKTISNAGSIGIADLVVAELRRGK